MVEPLKVRNRTRLREKDAEQLARDLEQRLGARPWPDATPVDRGESQLGDVLVWKNRVMALVVKGEAGERVMLSVRGLLEAKPARGCVTVDMGAVKFVNNGADIMGPGIVEADVALQPGDLLWVRDERNKRPLAVGQALVPGTEMAKQPGKKVKNLHRVGDPLWDWEP
ncbi:MAG: RNA-binding protein [Halobacteriales archaeon]|nr:RNA-binding protein [Halobacteriales archaeon]